MVLEIYRCFIFVRPRAVEAGENPKPLISKISESRRFFKNNCGIGTGDILARIQDEDVRTYSAKKCSELINRFKPNEYFSVDIVRHSSLPKDVDAKDIHKVGTIFGRFINYQDFFAGLYYFNFLKNLK